MPTKSRLAHKIKKIRRILIGSRYVHIGKNTDGLDHNTILKNTNVKDPEFTKIFPNCNVNK